MTLQIHSLHLSALVCAVADEVGKILECLTTLLLDFQSFLATLAELLNRALEVEDNMVFRRVQDLPYGACDPVCITMSILDICKLSRDLIGQSVR